MIDGFFMLVFILAMIIAVLGAAELLFVLLCYFVPPFYDFVEERMYTLPLFWDWDGEEDDCA